MATLTDEQIDEYAGLTQTENTTPLLSPEQKTEMLSPAAPWYAKRWVQVAVVGVVVAVPGAIMYLAFSGGGSPTTTARHSETESEALLKQQLAEEIAARQEAETDGAFGKQNAMTAAPVAVKTPPKPKTVQPIPVRRAASVPPAPRRIYRSTPQITPVRRSFTNPVAIAPRSYRREDPEQAWKRLADLGSYGGDSSPAIAAATPTGYTPAAYTPPPTIEADYVPSASVPTDAPSGPVADNSAPAIGISIPAGTEAKGELMFPVLWAQDISINEDEFMVKLSQPLGTGLPKGTLVMIKPDKISGSGLISFVAVRATVNGEDRVLPDGIRVVATNGSYLQASVKRPGSGFNFNDVFGVVLGGAKTATSLINQPNTSSYFNGYGYQTSSSGSSDVLAGFAEGAADELLSRSKSRIQQIQTNRSPYFVIGKGTSVKLLVTQSISM